MDFENMPIDKQFFAGFDKQTLKVPPPWHQAIAALAAIDTELGLPEDGCNSTARTLAEVARLHGRIADLISERARCRAWIEEAVSYVGCTAWSPSLKEEGDALLLAKELRDGRDPLTDDQLKAIQQPYLKRGRAGNLAFARAVERAHGIGA